MVLVLAIVVTGLLLGANIFQQKSAFIVSDIKNQTLNGKNFITVFLRAGDEVIINPSLSGSHEMGIYIDNKTTSWRVQPVSGLDTVKPGTTLFIYYNTSKNIYQVTLNAATLSTSEAQSVVECPLAIRLVDEQAHLLITTWNWTCVPLPPTGPAPTVTSITNTTGNRGWPVIESITGTNFLTGATAKFNRSGTPDIPAASCTYVSSTKMVCTFDLLGKTASPPNYNVVVTNPDGKQGMRANYFVLSSSAPTITSSTPATGVQGTTVKITRLLGTYFQPGATVTYWQGATIIPLQSVNVVASTNITGTLYIPSDAPVGLYNVTVTNTDGKTVTRASTFTVTSNAPKVTGITPNTYVRGWTVSITNLAGSLFQPGAIVTLVNSTAGPDITANNVVVNPANTSITCTFDLTGAPAAKRTVIVTNPDGKTGTYANAFTITSNAPTLTARNPTTGIRGWPVSIISLTGTGFQPGAEVRLQRSGYPDVIATGVNVASPTSINAGTFDLTGVTAGTWNVVVIVDGKASGTQTFTVTNPTLTVRNPISGNRGWPVSIISLTGTGFRPGAEVRLQRSGYSDVIATGVNVASPTSINAGTFDLLGITAGAWTIRVINPDGGSSGTLAFTVNSLAPAIPITPLFSPASGARGTNGVIVTAPGTSLQPGMAVVLTSASAPTTKITASSVNVVSPTQVIFTFDIPAGATTGSYTARYTNSDGQTITQTTRFTVT
ncbi:MAG: hypothetical protein CVV30_01200 [Methanomicrobiales archaeon HGW-Methanomicrobiales-1]|nr:MAG: hypothetical protein CVV30_01200 [Methanomicrobiales archaeon HGW-Methanomicrobiales-1]